MDTLTAFNQCLAWLTEATPLPAKVDGLVLCGNSVPVTATIASQLAQYYQLPTIIIAGGIGHATKYLRQNLHVENDLSEAQMMAELVRHGGYQGEIQLDQTSTNTGSNATNARDLAPNTWQHVLLVQDPLLARRTALTFSANWDSSIQLSRYQPDSLQLATLQPFQLTTQQYQNAWPAAYFTELLLGELQRLADTPTGYGPNGKGFIPHVEIPATVMTAFDFLQNQSLNRQR
ncbi:YdcF family protein [Lactiplantibacillus herbarum]|uniref:YdcF family protein n=1 Tax=Lactiplantibacillus herbarum TaxID=1670446 RepID=UPI00064F0CD6|nr:YdcF family protein [Lactiplantibacillus herbarum]